MAKVKMMWYVHATKVRNRKSTSVKIPAWGGEPEALRLEQLLQGHGWINREVTAEAISEECKHYRPFLDNWDEQSGDYIPSSELEFTVQGRVRR